MGLVWLLEEQPLNLIRHIQSRSLDLIFSARFLRSRRVCVLSPALSGFNTSLSLSSLDTFVDSCRQGPLQGL